jgi:hypothetical protein
MRSRGISKVAAPLVLATLGYLAACSDGGGDAFGAGAAAGSGGTAASGGTGGTAASGGTGGTGANGGTPGGTAGRAGSGGTTAGTGGSTSSTGGRGSAGVGGSVPSVGGGKGEPAGGVGGGGGTGDGEAGSGAPRGGSTGMSPYEIECHGDTVTCGDPTSLLCLGIRVEMEVFGYSCSNECESDADCSGLPASAEAGVGCVDFVNKKYCLLVCKDRHETASCPTGMYCYVYEGAPTGYCLWH